jgi:hypothetical protein
MMNRANIFRTLVFGAVLTAQAFACSRLGEISNVAIVSGADVIVRAIAQEYAVAPPAPEKSSGGSLMYPTTRGAAARPSTPATIRFKVLETIRGAVGPAVILPGQLVDQDDFNDQPAPYTFVRKNGRKGNCFADSYRSGAPFLLLLKKTEAGALTANWYALGPVNEQLHAEDDPWLLWVRKQAH